MTVAGGKQVRFLLGSGDLAAPDLDGKIEVMSKDTGVVVAAAGTSGKIQYRANLADRPACATVAGADHCLFIRTAKKPICIAAHSP